MIADRRHVPIPRLMALKPICFASPCESPSTSSQSAGNRIRRSEVLSFVSGLEPCLIGMEACATSHYWGRELAKFGHTVKLMPPAYVKPYVKRGKNDATDAEAICEAVSRPNMRFVPVKSAD